MYYIMNYYDKYMKYKNKYIELKSAKLITGGAKHIINSKIM